jgi:hypothetical protein
MKKFIFSLLFVLALVVAVSPAFALQCKEGNYGSDECWTEVKVSAAETTPVVSGTVLKFDVATDSADRNAFEVRVATATADYAKIAGVAQGRIATGDRGMILVRGQGQIKVTGGGIATGDPLFVGGAAGTVSEASADAVTVGLYANDPVGFALESSTAASATIDGYVTVL